MPEEQQQKPKAARSAQKYRNVSRGVQVVCGIRVPSGDSIEITAEMKKNEAGMKKLGRAVEMGLLERV